MACSGTQMVMPQRTQKKSILLLHCSGIVSSKLTRPWFFKRIVHGGMFILSIPHLIAMIIAPDQSGLLKSCHNLACQSMSFVILHSA